MHRECKFPQKIFYFVRIKILQFVQNFSKSFVILLGKLNFFGEDTESNELVFNCVSKTVQSIAEYTKKQFVRVIWKCFYVRLFLFIRNTNLTISLFENYYFLRLALISF